MNQRIKSAEDFTMKKYNKLIDTISKYKVTHSTDWRSKKKQTVTFKNMQAFVIYIQGILKKVKIFKNSCSIIRIHLDIEKFYYRKYVASKLHFGPMKKEKDYMSKKKKTGLLLSAYKTYDNNKRIAAAQSHYMLWQVRNTESPQ